MKGISTMLWFAARRPIWLAESNFGLSGQVVPEILDKLMPNPEKGTRVNAEVMKMTKPDMNVMKKSAGM